MNEKMIEYLKEKGFKEDGKFLGYEEGSDYFAYNTETKDFSLVGNGNKTIEYYMQKFNIREEENNE